MSSTDPKPFSLREWLKSAPWLVIAIALHAAVLAGLYVWHVGRAQEEDASTPTDVVLRPRPVENEIAPPPPQIFDRHFVPENVEAELVEIERHDDYVPLDLVEDLDFTKEIGDPSATDEAASISSTNVGVGIGGVKGGDHTSVFTTRGALHPTGGVKGDRPGGVTQGTEGAVLEGMRWLLRHQNEDGSWSAATCAQNCASSKPCREPSATYSHLNDTGLTGLALLAFMGTGLHHDSQQTIADIVQDEQYKVGEQIKKGLLWLADQQQKNGSFSAGQTFMYNEALATMALVEDYGLTRAKYWREPAQKGVAFLCRAQRVDPDGEGLWGWRYRAREEVEAKYAGTGGAVAAELFDSDVSVTAWCVMALKSAQLCGFDVPAEHMQGALAFVDSCTDKSGSGLVGYLSAEGAGRPVLGGPHSESYLYHSATMSALGMLVRTFVAHDVDDPVLELSAKVLIKDLPNGDVPSGDQARSPLDYYYWYYGSLALNQFDGRDSPRRTGKYWDPWEEAMSAVLLDLQSKEDRSCERGGWMEPDRWSFHDAGPIYSTAINVLTLEVYYRYENAFGARIEGARKAPVRAADPVRLAAPE